MTLFYQYDSPQRLLEKTLSFELGQGGDLSKFLAQRPQSVSFKIITQYNILYGAAWLRNQLLDPLIDIVKPTVHTDRNKLIQENSQKLLDVIIASLPSIPLCVDDID